MAVKRAQKTKPTPVKVVNSVESSSVLSDLIWLIGLFFSVKMAFRSGKPKAHQNEAH